MVTQGSFLPIQSSMRMRLSDYKPHCSDHGSGKDWRDIPQRLSTGYGIKA
jgi:hypothetical protein